MECFKEENQKEQGKLFPKRKVATKPCSWAIETDTSMTGNRLSLTIGRQEETWSPKPVWRMTLPAH